MGQLGARLTCAALISIWLLSGDGHRTNAGQDTNVASSGPANSLPDISGFWEPRADGRGRGTPPKLTPEGHERQAARQKTLASGDSGVTEVARWCGALAFPFYLTSSPPWDIIVGPKEIVVLAERQEASRHIFMDGRSHPDSAHLEITANGDSIGHWVGDTLVVDTIGLRGGIDTTGTYRGPHQHLMERYRLLDHGRLSLTLTWEDPDVYAEPYTTQRVYYRSNPSMYAMEDWCDASDVSQWRSDAAPLPSGTRSQK